MVRRSAGKPEGESSVLVADEEDNSQSDDHSQDEHFCHACGQEVDPQAAFCSGCGEKTRQAGCSPFRRRRYFCCCCMCCSSLCCFVTFLLVACCLVLHLNAGAKFAAETLGSAFLGVDVTLEAMDLGLLHGRASITGLNVASPAGYESDFLKTGLFVFDVSPMTLLSGWLSGFMKPIELEEITLRGCAVSVEIKTTDRSEEWDSNAKDIVNHMNTVTGQVAPQLHEKLTHFPDLSRQEGRTAVHEGLRPLEARVKVDRVELRGLSVSIAVVPLTPLTYELNTILITDVGKKGDGVYLYEFLDIVVRALLMSVLRSAPRNIQANLARAFGRDLWRNLDYALVQFDAGHGLQDVGQFAGWVTYKAAMLPLEAAKLGMDIDTAALKTGVAVNTAALKTGLEVTEAGVELGAEATEAAMRLQLAFANGLAHAMTR